MKRQLAAAFDIVNGKKELVQPELEELETPRDSRWYFWIEKGWSQQPDTIGLFSGALFMFREEKAEQFEKTPELARWLRESFTS